MDIKVFLKIITQFNIYYINLQTRKTNRTYSSSHIYQASINHSKNNKKNNDKLEIRQTRPFGFE